MYVAAVHPAVVFVLLIAVVGLMAFLAGSIFRRNPSAMYAGLAVLMGLAALWFATHDSQGVVLAIIAGSALVASAILKSRS